MDREPAHSATQVRFLAVRGWLAGGTACPASGILHQGQTRCVTYSLQRLSEADSRWVKRPTWCEDYTGEEMTSLQNGEEKQFVVAQELYAGLPDINRPGSLSKNVARGLYRGLREAQSTEALAVGQALEEKRTSLRGAGGLLRKAPPTPPMHRQSRQRHRREVRPTDGRAVLLGTRSRTRCSLGEQKVHSSGIPTATVPKYVLQY